MPFPSRPAKTHKDFNIIRDAMTPMPRGTLSESANLLAKFTAKSHELNSALKELQTREATEKELRKVVEDLRSDNEQLRQANMDVETERNASQLARANAEHERDLAQQQAASYQDQIAVRDARIQELKQAYEKMAALNTSLLKLANNLTSAFARNQPAVQVDRSDDQDVVVNGLNVELSSRKRAFNGEFSTPKRARTEDNDDGSHHGNDLDNFPPDNGLDNPFPGNDLDDLSPGNNVDDEFEPMEERTPQPSGPSTLKKTGVYEPAKAKKA
jgi:hypothetical protein